MSVTKDRYKYLGGSEMPTIMGINPFKSRFDLLLEKAGYKEDTFEGNEYTEFGNALEPKIRKFINSSIKDPFKEDSLIQENLRGNTDGVNSDTVLEIKTTSQTKKTTKGYKTYLVQLLFYMSLYHKEKGILAVYERPKDFDTEFVPLRLQTFEIDIKDHQELLKEIYRAINEFWEDLEIVKENPFITEAELERSKIWH